MKKLFILFVSIMAVMPALARNERSTACSDISITHDSDSLRINLKINRKALGVNRNQALMIMPELVSASDTLQLHPVGIYGRNRYYHYVRNGKSLLSDDGVSYMNNKAADILTYSQTVAYRPWMSDCDLSVKFVEYGCCSRINSSETAMIAGFEEKQTEIYIPEIIYISPRAEAEKTRALEGSAFIDFPVDRTEIHPDYRRNATELAKIRAGIDSVINDPDVTITSLWLKGYASPESPYRHNADLALGRTESLKKYLLDNYHFDDSLITTAYEPEDWEGLRRFVEKCTELKDRDAILAIIDSDIEPDAKEMKLRKSHAADYRYLLKNSFPALRHTDYRITYKVRSFTDLEEIRRMLRENPSKLSLNEMYLIGQTYEPGSEEFTDLFETAVRLYPDDTTANINAAAAQLKAGNTAKAAKYLERSGNSPEAEYLRGLCALESGDRDKARRHIARAADSGLPQAVKTLERIFKD